jgi:V/A-type H+-transporting ATPase subunit E
MSLEKILQRIVDDAQAEAERIIQENKMKGEEIKEKSRQEASELADSLLEMSERKANLEASRLITQARLEGRLNLLSSKKKLIEEVLERAFQIEGLQEKRMKKEIVLKEGKREESFDEEKLKDELRPLLEGYIAKVLKI